MRCGRKLQFIIQQSLSQLCFNLDSSAVLDRVLLSQFSSIAVTKGIMRHVIEHIELVTRAQRASHLFRVTGNPILVG